MEEERGRRGDRRPAAEKTLREGSSPSPVYSRRRRLFFVPDPLLIRIYRHRTTVRERQRKPPPTPPPAFKRGARTTLLFTDAEGCCPTPLLLFAAAAPTKTSQRPPFGRRRDAGRTPRNAARYRRGRALDGPPVRIRNPTTSFLTAATLIYAIGAGITAAAGTRLALQWILVQVFKLNSFRLRGLGRVPHRYFSSLPPRAGIG